MHRWIPTLLEQLRDGDPLDAAGLVTHEVPLAEAPAMYEAFKRKDDGVVKAVFRP